SSRSGRHEHSNIWTDFDTPVSPTLMVTVLRPVPGSHDLADAGSPPTYTAWPSISTTAVTSWLASTPPARAGTRFGSVPGAVASMVYEGTCGASPSHWLATAETRAVAAMRGLRIMAVGVLSLVGGVRLRVTGVACQVGHGETGRV